MSRLRAVCLVLVGMWSVLMLRAADDAVPVVRVAAPLTIDGLATDWRVPSYAELESADGAARMRFAADATAFYAFVTVADPTPLGNGAARVEELFVGGDAVAFYFRTGKDDAQRVAVARRAGKLEVCAYRSVSGDKKPYTFSSPVGDTHFDFVAAIVAQAAVQVRDGEGYDLEIAIPWTSLGLSAAPAKMAFDAQVMFADPGGTQTAGMAGLIATDGPGYTIEDVPTMVRLYPDGWGRAEIVDTLRQPRSRATLPPETLAGMTWLEVELPRDGRLSLNIVAADGWILRELVRAEWFAAGKQRIAWDGRDRYGEPLPPGDYGWQALLFDGMQTTFLCSVGTSARPPYRTADGLGATGGQHGTHKSVAADAGGVYLANAVQEGPPIMRKVDPATARTIWNRSAGSFAGIDAIAADEGMACIVNGLGKRQGYASDLVRIDPETGQDVAMGEAEARFRIPGVEVSQAVHGLAIVGGIAWYSLPAQNRIDGVDLRSGEVQPAIELPSPEGLARRDAHTLLVCSGAAVLAVDLRDRSVTPVLQGLDTPRAVAVGAAGALYVSELGATQQVGVFSAAGERRATWGREGGKHNQQIPYEPMAFRNIVGITVGPQGKVWLAEADGLVRRFVILDAQGGWQEDLYGPVAYNAFGPDLDDFSRVYYTVSGGCFIETHIDYAQYRRDPLQPAKAWQIRAIHDLGLAADGQTVNALMRSVAQTGYGHVVAFRAANGQRYFVRHSKHNRAKVPPGAGIWIERDGRWLPCAFLARDTKNHRSWADRNGDGLIQDDETYADLPIDEVAWFDRDLTAHGFEGRLTPASFTESGAPVYAGGAFAPYLAAGEPSHVGDQWTFFSPGVGDGVYYISNHGQHRHLSFWDRATENRLIKISGGTVQWIAGQHAAHPDITEFSTNSGIAGVVDGVVLVQNIEPASYIAYTEDGFVLGDIMADPLGRHPKVGPNVINIESFTGLYVKEAATGRNVLFAVSSGDDRILEVTGPGETTRLDGRVRLDRAAPLGSRITIPYSTWWGDTTRGMGVDATDAEWRPEVRPFSVLHDGQVVADVRLRRDAGSLHVFATVFDETPAIGDRLQLTMVDAEQEKGASWRTLVLTLDKDADGIWIATGNLLQDNNIDESATAKVALAMRWRGLGYRLEAEVSLEHFGPLAEPREQTYRRGDEKRKMTSFTKTLPDLRLPAFAVVTVYQDGQPLGSSTYFQIPADAK